MIDSVNNEKILFFKKLRDKKYILENNMFIVEGEHLVEEAYKSGILLEVIKSNKCSISYDVKTTIVSDKCLEKISLLKSTPNIMGVVKFFLSDKIVGKKIVLLDNVQDPGNVGTIIRSALAFNVSTIVLSMDSVNIYNDKLYYADMHGSINLDNSEVKDYALVLGSEGKGISSYIKEKADEGINIPMNSKCESLNVGVSGSIIMYKFR